MDPAPKGVNTSVAKHLPVQGKKLASQIESSNTEDDKLPPFWSCQGLRARWRDPLFRKMFWNILLLSWSWSLGEGALFIQISTTTVAATNFASRQLATIPIGFMLFVATIWSVILPRAIGRFGYRPPLYFGALMGMTGAGLCIIATWHRIFWLLTVGAGFLGGQVPCTLYYRLVALQFATPEFAPKAIAMVVAGGCLSAFIGPEIAKHTVNALPKLYSGAYLTTLVECSILLFTMTIIQYPDNRKADYALVSTSVSKSTRDNNKKNGRSLCTIASQRTFIISVLGSFVSWSAMVIQMSATPLAMNAVGHNFARTTTAIECHLLGMFTPSFFTGTLCKWFGNRIVMITGFLTQLTGALLFQRGFEFGHFNLGLIIVGIGWNLGYVGASALLPLAHRPEEKAEIHSLYEAINMFGISIASLSSAFILQHFGWMFLTGRIISIYLGIATVILLADTAYVFYQTKSIRKEIVLDDDDLEIPE